MREIMGLKNRVDQLARKLKPAREPIVVGWVDPKTGEWSWRIRLEPGGAVIEEVPCKAPAPPAP